MEIIEVREENVEENAECYQSNKVQSVQVSDTTGDATSTKSSSQKKSSQIPLTYDSLFLSASKKQSNERRKIIEFY